MKKIFTIIGMFISLFSFSQTYNPSNFTVSNKPYGSAQSFSTDARSQFWDATNFVFRDYASTNEVNSYLNLPKYRGGHIPIYIHLGGSLGAGVWTGGITQVWLYKNGVADSNLVRWYTDSTAGGGGITQLTGDVIAGPGAGSVSSSLAIVNSNTGTFGNAANVLQANFDAKGRALSASNIPIQISESQVTNLTTDLAGKLSNITGLIQQGTNVTITGSGTVGSPYVINSTGGGGGSDSAVNPGLWLSQNIVGTTKTLNADSGAMAAYFLRRTDTTFQTLEQVLNTGSTLLTNHTVDINHQVLLFNNAKTFSIVSVSQTGDTSAIISADAPTAQTVWSIADLSNSTSTTMRPESIQIISPLIALNTPSIIFSTYGSGTHFGLLAHRLGVTSTGDVIEDTTSSGGGGITTLNTLTAPTQTFATGTSGTDFNIVSATSTHTFNLPSSSASNRGLLTSVDWSTFNAKLTSTLASANIFVGNGSNVATSVTPSGDWTINNTGVNVIGNNVITYAKIQSAAGQGLMGATGAGNYGLINLGTNLSMSGSTLNAVSGGSSYIPYTFIYVSWGQSNAHGQAEDAGSGTDTSSSPRLLVFDRFNRIWRVAHVGVSPMSTTSPTNNSPTHWFYFGKKWITEHPNDTFRVIPTWADATAINQWFNGATKGPQMDTMTTVYNAAVAAAPWAMTHVDLCVGDQGESDNSTVPATYITATDSITSTMQRLQFWTGTANFVWVGMPDTLSGAPTGFQGIDPTLKTFDYSLNEYRGYAHTDSVSVNGGTGNHLHFNSYGLWKLGTQRIYAAWVSHPSRNFERGNAGLVPGSSALLSRIDIVHNSPPGTGAQVAGVYTTNQSSTGRTGYYGYNNDSTGKFFMGITGTAATYAGVSGMVMGTETNSDFNFFRNFTLYMQLLSGGITIPQRVTFTSTGQQQITNATTNGAPGLAINGDGSNFGQVSIGNSANVTIPNAMYFYFSNGYKIRIGANGTAISDTTTAPSDPVNTLHVNGSFGRRIDSLTTVGNVLLNKRNNVYMFKTGSSIDTCFLPSAAGCYGRVYTIMKIDTGTSGTVLISPFSGQFIDRQAVKPILTGSSSITTIISNGSNGWYTLSSGGGTPGGSNTQIQFNNSGVFGASTNLTWASNILTSTGMAITTLVNAGANDSVLMWNPSTKQVEMKSAALNLFAENGATWTGGNTLTAFSGSLNQTSSVSGAGFQLNLGTSGSHISQFNLYADTILLNGGVQFSGGNPTDANLTVGNEGMLYLLPVITANRTITLPSAANSPGRVLVFPNANNTAFNWSFSTAVTNPGGSAVTTLINSSTYILQSHGSAGWIIISQSDAWTPLENSNTTNNIGATGFTANDYTFTGGSSANWTMPDRAANIGRRIFFKNAGSANLTLTAAGSDQIYDASAGTTVVLTPGTARVLVAFPTYWQVE